MVSQFVKEGLSFAWDLSLETSGFYWLYFTQCRTSFSSINHLLRLCSRFLILFHLTDEVLSINPSLMCLSLEIFTFIIRTGLPILVKLIHLVNSVIIFLSRTTLLRWLTFLLEILTVILTVLLF